MSVESVSVVYPARKGRASGPPARAVDDVSFELVAGKTLGLVGESGSGKSSLARVLSGLLTPVSGAISLRGQAVDLETLSGRRAYYRQVQLVLQNSRASFNPRRRLRSTVEAARRALAPDLPDSALSEACELVGLPPALLDRFPHEISGGQAQRAALVRALSVRPSVLVLDEPAASLDATLKQKLVAALANVQGALGVACLFITHELSLVALVAADVLLMHEGRIVERGPTEQVLSAPTSEHGRLLLKLTPRLSL